MKEKWIKGRYAYLSKRRNKLFLNILIEDENSTYRDNVHNWILNNVVIENKIEEISIVIKYSEFNNSEKITLSQEQEDLVREYALEIAEKYNIK